MSAADRGRSQGRDRQPERGRDRSSARNPARNTARNQERGRGRSQGQGRAERDRFSTATRLRVLGQQTAARVYRSRTRRRARRSRLTGRAAVLALVLCTLIVALAYPIRQYVSQRAEIDDLQQQREQERARVEHLRDLKARWQDDAYAEQQIRRRLHYVRPGETGYHMVKSGADGSAHHDEGAGLLVGRPWYGRLWDAVDRADRGAPGIS